MIALPETHNSDDSALKAAFHEVWITHPNGGHEMEWQRHWRCAKHMERFRPDLYRLTVYPALVMEARRKLKESAA